MPIRFRRFVAVAACSVWLPCSAGDVVRVWIKAFIPNSHPTLPDYMKPVPGQPGKSMVEAPFRDNAMAQQLGLFDACFTTDHRGFSDKPAASARLTSDFTLSVEASTVTMKPSTSRGLQFTDLTHKIDCKTGAPQQAARSGTVEDCGVGEPATAGNVVMVTLGCRSKNPFFNIPSGPSIDYNGVVTYDKAAKTVAFKGDVGAFPAFEAYASLNGGTPKSLFKVQPAPKATTWSLYDMWLGVNTRAVVVPAVKLQ